MTSQKTESNSIAINPSSSDVVRFNILALDCRWCRRRLDWCVFELWYTKTLLALGIIIMRPLFSCKFARRDALAYIMRTNLQDCSPPVIGGDASWNCCLPGLSLSTHTDVTTDFLTGKAMGLVTDSFVCASSSRHWKMMSFKDVRMGTCQFYKPVIRVTYGPIPSTGQNLSQRTFYDRTLNAFHNGLNRERKLN